VRPYWLGLGMVPYIVRERRGSSKSGRGVGLIRFGGQVG
jgi:hypothetical protein